MSYLLDSDVVIEYLHGRDSCVRFVGDLFLHGLLVSAVTVGEVVHGIELGRNPEKGYEEFDRFLNTVAVAALDIEIGIAYGKLRATLRRSGMPLGDADIIIAATALQLGCTLVTGNRRHFERIPNLVLLPLPRPER